MKLSLTITKFMILFAALAVMTSCVSKKKYTEALTRAAAEKSALESQLATAQDENEKLKGDAEKLQGNLNMKTEEILALSETIKENNAKIAQLQNAISEAFETYDSDDLTVEERNGKLYITMANRILFNAGRATVAKESKEIIAKLADVIKKNQGLTILVEGHTDNDPVKIHRAKYKDNWSLSVARSINVVRELEGLGVTTNRLTASGKGDTQPVASNDTDEGKEKNRRTEFVVVPSIDGLYRMYKEDFGGTASGMN